MEETGGIVAYVSSGKTKGGKERYGIKLDNDAEWYNGFGMCQVKKGDTVIISYDETEYGPQIKSISKTGSKQPKQEKIEEKKAPQNDSYWKNKEKRDMAKDPVITRLSCISSASRVISALIRSGEFKTPKEAMEQLKGLTEILETYAKEAKQEKEEIEAYI